jgi:elongator complex protein 3
MPKKMDIKTAKKVATEIARKASETNNPDARKLNSIKKEVSKKYKFRELLTNIQILTLLSSNDVKKYRKIFTTKPTRTGSGVAVVAVMAKPYPCPHGKCSFCPGGPESEFGCIPQSYTGREPATMRGIRNQYDPYLQVMNRLEQ